MRSTCLWAQHANKSAKSARSDPCVVICREQRGRTKPTAPFAPRRDARRRAASHSGCTHPCRSPHVPYTANVLVESGRRVAAESSTPAVVWGKMGWVHEVLEAGGVSGRACACFGPVRGGFRLGSFGFIWVHLGSGVGFSVMWALLVADIRVGREKGKRAGP